MTMTDGRGSRSDVRTPSAVAHPFDAGSTHKRATRSRRQSDYCLGRRSLGRSQIGRAFQNLLRRSSFGVDAVVVLQISTSQPRADGQPGLGLVIGARGTTPMRYAAQTDGFTSIQSRSVIAPTARAGRDTRGFRRGIELPGRHRHLRVRQRAVFVIANQPPALIGAGMAPAERSFERAPRRCY
jgi:hypothetical protein